MPRCTETPPAIIAKLSALASTNVPKTTNANVEYAARLASSLCHASRLRSESTSTETAPIITAGAGPHSAIASTSAKNAPLMRSALCWSASRSLTIASASRTITSPTGCQSSAVEDAAAATSVPRRITASAASSLLERAGMVWSGRDAFPGSPPPLGGSVVPPRGRRKLRCYGSDAGARDRRRRRGARRGGGGRPVAHARRDGLLQRRLELPSHRTLRGKLRRRGARLRLSVVPARADALLAARVPRPRHGLRRAPGAARRDRGARGDPRVRAREAGGRAARARGRGRAARARLARRGLHAVLAFHGRQRARGLPVAGGRARRPGGPAR